MGNCYKVFYFGRLVGIFGSQARANRFIALELSDRAEQKISDYKVELAFVEGAGF
jgi:hypothetical protein